MLLNDFKMVLGSELPYRQLGHQRVEDFLQTIPNVVRVDRGPMGDPTCFAIADSTTSQIARFVASQKKPKLKKSCAPPLVRKPMYTGFTKKSKFGPSSARPKVSPYASRVGGGGGGGRSFSGPGNVYMGGNPKPNRPAYSFKGGYCMYSLHVLIKVGIACTHKGGYCMYS